MVTRMNNEHLIRFSLSVPIDSMDRTLRRLYLFAQEQNFRHISPILSFSGEECQIREKDPCASMKLEAQGLALANGRLLTFLPDRFSAFGCQLPNKRLLFIGFAVYPSEIKVSSGTTFSTPWLGQAVWHSTAATMDSRFSDGANDCRESHRVACSLMCHAHHLQVLKIIEDGNGFHPKPDVNCCEELMEGLTS